jgi:hypothetical protein
MLGLAVASIVFFELANHTKNIEFQINNYMVKHKAYGHFLYKYVYQNPISKKLCIKNIKLINKSKFPFEHKIEKANLIEYKKGEKLPKNISISVEKIHLNLIDVADKLYSKKPEELEILKNFNVKNDFAKNPLKLLLISGIKEINGDIKFSAKQNKNSFLTNFEFNDNSIGKIKLNVLFSNVNKETQKSIISMTKIGLNNIGAADYEGELSLKDIENLKAIKIDAFDIKLEEKGFFEGLKKYIENADFTNIDENNKAIIDDETELKSINFLVDNKIKTSLAKSIMETLAKASKKPQTLVIKSNSKEPFYIGELSNLDLENLIKLIKLSQPRLKIPNKKELFRR